MNAPDFFDKINRMAMEYMTLNGIEVVDEEGNPITKVTIDNANNKMILSIK